MCQLTETRSRACGAAVGLQGEVGTHHGDGLWTWRVGKSMGFENGALTG